MAIATDEIIGLLSTLAQDENLRVTVKQSLKGGLIAGGCAAAGGMMMGPIGLAIGGAVGGCVAAAAYQNSFLPVGEVLANMNCDQRNQLAQRIRNIIENVNGTDIAMLGALVAGNMGVRNRIMAELLNFLRDEMAMAIVDA